MNAVKRAVEVEPNYIVTFYGDRLEKPYPRTALDPGTEPVYQRYLEWVTSLRIPLEPNPVASREAYFCAVDGDYRLAYFDLDRKEILARRRPHPADLRFNRYAWNKKPSICTVAGIKSELERALDPLSKGRAEMPAADQIEDRTPDVTTEIIEAPKRKGYITPKDRQLLRIVRWQQYRGLTHEQIARRMGLSTAKVQRMSAEIDQLIDHDVCPEPSTILADSPAFRLKPSILGRRH